jgi:hypothetical protein
LATETARHYLENSPNLAAQQLETRVMDEVQLANYVAGLDPGPVEAGRVDQLLARMLTAPASSVIWLSDWTLTKTKFRHQDVTFADYKHLPEIITLGFVIDGRERNSAELIYVEVDQFAAKCWRVCLKHTARSESFITNSQRLHVRDARRIYRRALSEGKLRRDLKDALALRLMRRASGA